MAKTDAAEGKHLCQFAIIYIYDYAIVVLPRQHSVITWHDLGGKSPGKE